MGGLECGLTLKDNNANVRSYMYVIGKPSEPHLSSHVVERQGVGEGLAGGLDGEVVLVVANGKSGNLREVNTSHMYIDPTYLCPSVVQRLTPHLLGSPRAS